MRVTSETRAYTSSGVAETTTEDSKVRGVVCMATILPCPDQCGATHLPTFADDYAATALVPTRAGTGPAATKVNGVFTGKSS